MSAPTHVIACAPVHLPPDAPVYPNTDYPQVACPLCGQLMYLGPRSKAKHEADGTPIACMPCVLAHGGDPTRVQHLGGR